VPQHNSYSKKSQSNKEERVSSIKTSPVKNNYNNNNINQPINGDKVLRFSQTWLLNLLFCQVKTIMICICKCLKTQHILITHIRRNRLKQLLEWLPKESIQWTFPKSKNKMMMINIQADVKARITTLRIISIHKKLPYKTNQKKFLKAQFIQVRINMLFPRIHL